MKHGTVKVTTCRTFCKALIVDDKGKSKHLQMFWHSSDENNGTVKVTTCRNSVQGKALIIDDKVMKTRHCQSDHMSELSAG
ncbi:hypothetical protein J6590_082176 [Homalodisca vitripennis]|nr:hypothetical protein J6590_082176 [Homalodisca vitripennis]